MSFLSSLAYFATTFTTKKKGFITLTPGISVLNFFLFLANKLECFSPFSLRQSDICERGYEPNRRVAHNKLLHMDRIKPY